MTADLPLACSLSAAELRERGEEHSSLFRSATSARELADGYAFAFPADAERVSAVVRFILAERACCPFFSFQLDFPSPHDAIWLAIRGREGVKEIVHDAFAKHVTCDTMGREE